MGCGARGWEGWWLLLVVWVVLSRRYSTVGTVGVAALRRAVSTTIECHVLVCIAATAFLTSFSRPRCPCAYVAWHCGSSPFFDERFCVLLRVQE